MLDFWLLHNFFGGGAGAGLVGDRSDVFEPTFLRSSKALSCPADLVGPCYVGRPLRDSASKLDRLYLRFQTKLIA